MRPALRIAVLAAALASAGCSSLGYYAQSVTGHLDLLLRARPIDDVLSSGALAGRRQRQLERVADIRRFAVDELDLPDNGSYRYFADLDRAAVVWSVVATPEFSLVPRTWCYPVIGCAAYRGYYDEAEARRFAASLADAGMDVVVQPVPAYSTLGWLPDPVPGTVIDWSPWRLAGLLFHELAHQRLYLAGDSTFNESYATAVENEGVRRWLHGQRRPDWMEAWRQERARERDFLDLLADARAQLLELYAGDAPTVRKREVKAAVFAGLRAAYQRQRAAWGDYPGYDGWFARGANNAALAGIDTYERWVPAFTALLQREDNDMRRLHPAAAALSRLAPGERERRLLALQAEAGSAAAAAAPVDAFAVAVDTAQVAFGQRLER